MGTETMRPMLPTSVRTISIATTSRVSTWPTDRPSCMKKSSSAREEPTYASTRVFTVDATWSRPIRTAAA